MNSEPALVEMEVIIKDKDGNIKYQGPLKFQKEEDGRNPPLSDQNPSS